MGLINIFNNIYEFCLATTYLLTKKSTKSGTKKWTKKKVVDIGRKEQINLCRNLD